MSRFWAQRKRRRAGPGYTTAHRLANVYNRAAPPVPATATRRTISQVTAQVLQGPGPRLA